MLRLLFGWLFFLFMVAELPGGYAPERVEGRLLAKVLDVGQNDLISPFGDLQRLRHAPIFADHAASHLELYSDENNDRLLAEARAPRVPIQRVTTAAPTFASAFHSFQPRQAQRARAPPALG